MFEGLLRMMSVIENMLTFLQTLAVAGECTHPRGCHLLTFVTAHLVERFRHPIVVRAGNLVHHHRSQSCPIEELLCLELVHHGDASHHAGAVGDRKSLANMDFERFQPVLFQHFCSGSPLAVIVYTPLAYHRQGEVRQLHEIAAGPYTTVLGNHRENVAVDHLHEKLHQIGMHS